MGKNYILGRAYNTSLESYCDSVEAVWDSQQSLDGKLPPGQYNWPFCFLIPPSVPSSFEGEFGKIRYMLKGTIVTDSVPKHNHDVTAVITVQQLVPIANPHLLNPVRTEVQKTVWCLCGTSHPIKMSVAIPKSGFYIGESFQLHISLGNGSERQLTVTASLKEHTVYRARGCHRRVSRSLYRFKSNKVKHQETKNFNETITIPTNTVIVPNSSCGNIEVTHWLKITCHIPCASNLLTIIPLELANWQ